LIVKINIPSNENENGKGGIGLMKIFDRGNVGNRWKKNEL
jgi:hypothetical protein